MSVPLEQLSVGAVQSVFVGAPPRRQSFPLHEGVYVTWVSVAPLPVQVGEPAVQAVLTVDAVQPLDASQPRVVTWRVALEQVVDVPGLQPIEVARHMPALHASVT